MAVILTATISAGAAVGGNTGYLVVSAGGLVVLTILWRFGRDAADLSAALMVRTEGGAVGPIPAPRWIELASLADGCNALVSARTRAERALAQGPREVSSDLAEAASGVVPPGGPRRGVRLARGTAETRPSEAVERVATPFDESVAALNGAPIPSEVGPFSLSSHCRQVDSFGGDWWMCRRLTGSRLLVAIGDVTGHGAPAALVAATARGAVAGILDSSSAPLSPVQVLRAVDGAVRRVAGGEWHSTAFAMILDPEHQAVHFANASHAFPLAFMPVGERDLHALVARGNPLGSATMCIAEGRRTLRPGEVFVLATDGLADRVSRTGERFGHRRLRNLLERHRWNISGSGVETLRDAIVEATERFAGGVVPDDDLTFVICQYLAEAPVRRRVAKRCRVVETPQGAYVLEEDVTGVLAPVPPPPDVQQRLRSKR